MATEFRRIGHDHFIPNVLLNGEMTRTTNNPSAATYVYPTDDVENDMGPAAKDDPCGPMKLERVQKGSLAYNGRRGGELAEV